MCHNFIGSTFSHFIIDQKAVMHLISGILDLMEDSTVNYDNVTDILPGNCLCSQELLDKLNPFFSVLLSLFLLS